MKKILTLITFFVFVLLFITLSVKGNFLGNSVHYQNLKNRDTAPGGPFESSGSNSRFALTEAIVENKTFTFTPEQAAFSAPDISAYNGKNFSLFNPGVSFIGVPFYIFGKQFGIPQLFAFYSVTLFAVLNVFLIYLLARKLGAGLYASLIAGFLFLFGTNAFSYALSYTQHIMTTTTILLALLFAFSKRTVFNAILLGAVVSASLFFDVVNALFMLPILVYVFIKHFSITNESEKLRISFNPIIVAFLIGFIPLIMFLGKYNYELSGIYTKPPQMIGNAQLEKGKTTVKQNEHATENIQKINLPFESRRLLNGFNVLLLSNERSWLFYSPVILLGIGGFILLYKKRARKEAVIVASSVVLINILTYAMFIDPWGGWSYGARYLIPGAAIMAIGVAPILDKFRKNYFFIALFFILASLSIYINTLGAYTTSAIAPKVEAVALATPIPYTPEYNLQLLDQKNLSSSLLYNMYGSSYISSRDYITLFSSLLIIAVLILYILSYKEKLGKENV